MATLITHVTYLSCWPHHIFSFLLIRFFDYTPWLNLSLTPHTIFPLCTPSFTTVRLPIILHRCSTTMCRHFSTLHMHSSLVRRSGHCLSCCASSPHHVPMPAHVCVAWLCPYSNHHPHRDSPPHHGYGNNYWNYKVRGVQNSWMYTQWTPT